MVNNNVEYVDLGPGYEGEDPELDFDPTEGKGGLVPFSVDSGAIKVNLGGSGPDGTGHDDYTYSGIIRNEQKFDFSIIVSYVRDYIPDSHQGKMIVQQATSMGLWLMRSRSLQRRRLLEGFEERASQWTRKMGRKADRESQLDQVDKHLAKWAKANMRQARIRVERLTYGLDFVDNDAYLQDWFLADREMRESRSRSHRVPVHRGLPGVHCQDGNAPAPPAGDGRPGPAPAQRRPLRLAGGHEGQQDHPGPPSIGRALDNPGSGRVRHGKPGQEQSPQDSPGTDAVGDDSHRQSPRPLLVAQPGHR